MFLWSKLSFSKCFPWAAWLRAIKKNQTSNEYVKNEKLKYWLSMTVKAVLTWWQRAGCIFRRWQIGSENVFSHVLPTSHSATKTHVSRRCWARIRRSQGGNETGRAERGTLHNRAKECNDCGPRSFPCMCPPPLLPRRSNCCDSEKLTLSGFQVKPIAFKYVSVWIHINEFILENYVRWEEPSGSVVPRHTVREKDFLRHARRSPNLLQPYGYSSKGTDGLMIIIPHRTKEFVLYGGASINTKRDGNWFCDVSQWLACLLLVMTLANVFAFVELFCSETNKDKCDEKRCRACYDYAEMFNTARNATLESWLQDHFPFSIEWCTTMRLYFAES